MASETTAILPGLAWLPLVAYTALVAAWIGQRSAIRKGGSRKR
jgi:hypothetical protein